MSVIHPLRLRYSNAYLVVGGRPILVDTGSRGDAAKIVAGCAAAGVTIRDLPGAMASVDRILAATSGRLFVGHGGPLKHEAVVKWRCRHDGRK